MHINWAAESSSCKLAADLLPKTHVSHFQKCFWLLDSLRDSQWKTKIKLLLFFFRKEFGELCLTITVPIHIGLKNKYPNSLTFSVFTFTKNAKPAVLGSHKSFRYILVPNYFFIVLYICQKLVVCSLTIDHSLQSRIHFKQMTNVIHFRAKQKIGMTLLFVDTFFWSMTREGEDKSMWKLTDTNSANVFFTNTWFFLLLNIFWALFWFVWNNDHNELTFVCNKKLNSCRRRITRAENIIHVISCKLFQELHFYWKLHTRGVKIEYWKKFSVACEIFIILKE